MRSSKETVARVVEGAQPDAQTAEVWDAAIASPTATQGSGETKQFFSLPRTQDGDFLARAALIDTGLRALWELEHGSEPDSAAATQGDSIWQEITDQIHATHQWWTDFEGKLNEKLARGTGRSVHPEQRAQVEDDLVAMQASLMECQSLVTEARSATFVPIVSRRAGDKAPQRTPSARLRGGLMGAIKACHHLRDNLVMLLPEPPLQFRTGLCGSGVEAAQEPTPPSYVAEQGLAGFTATIETWQSQLTKGTPNIASMLLVDFDRTTQWNQKLGVHATDWILDSCHRQIAGLIRQNRGFDRVIRVGGQQFLVFLGGTPVASAKFAADRLRQVFEQTTWQVADQSIVLHCSLTVGSLQVNQPLVAQINGLRLGMAEAKRLGGNVVVEPSSTGRFQQISGVPVYSLPHRQHRQP